MVRSVGWVKKQAPDIKYIVIKPCAFTGYEEMEYHVICYHLMSDMFDLFDPYAAKVTTISYKQLAELDVRYFTLKEIKGNYAKKEKQQ